MDKFKKILTRIMHPHTVIIFLLTTLSATGLFYVFYNGNEESIVAYAVYVISFYTLSIIVFATPPIFKKCKDIIYGNAHAIRYLTETELRTRISLCFGTLINLAYAVLKLLTGVYAHSFWFGAVAVYYMVLCLIRFLLIKNDRRSVKIETEEVRLLHNWKSYRACGWLLLALNGAMTGMVFQMIWQNKGYSYPGFVIYASAAYTFYRMTMAVIRTVKIRKTNNPVFSAAKAIDLCVALMAVFALQTAMFSSFGADMGSDARRLMNTLTGGTVCFAVVCIAVFMIIRSSKAINKINQEVA